MEKNNGFIVEPSVCQSAPLVGGDDCYSEMPKEVSNGSDESWELLPSEMDWRSVRLEVTYVALEFLQPDLDLLDVVANTTNHGLKGSRYRNLLSDSGSQTQR